MGTEGYNLLGGVDARIGATGRVNDHRFGRNLRNRILQSFLNRGSVVLNLVAAERTAVIFDAKCQPH